MAKIFISYRRRDSGYVTDSISQKLQQHFGKDSVFYDIDTIPLGVDFREHIGNAVGQCDVLLAVIGEKWVTAVDKQGNKRLDNPTDNVRIEIESALKRDIPVIPVLVYEAQIPLPADLPESIQSIIYRNAAEIREGANFRPHLEKLINGLEKLFKTFEKPEPEKIEPEETKKENVQNPESKPETPEPADKRSIGDGQITNKQNERGRVMNIIKTGLSGYVDNCMWLGKAIPRHKLINAIGTYAPKVAPDDVLWLHDDTFFGGAKDGMLLTADGLYNHDISGKKFHYPYTKIQSVRVTTWKDPTSKVLINSSVLVNGKALTISQGADVSKKKELLADIIRRLAGL